MIAKEKDIESEGEDKVESRYMRLATELKKRIEDKTYKQGERLPSERLLAEKYGVSRMTARQALSYLEQENLVRREAGSGTYVKALSFEQDNVNSFTETIGLQGYSAKTEVLEFSTIYSLKEIATAMNIQKDVEFYKLKRLRYGNEMPMALETLYIPKIYCPGLGENNLENSFYELLKDRYNTEIKKVSSKIEAIIANPLEQKLFKLTKPMALLRVSGNSFDQEGKAFLYEYSLYRSDLYRYQVDIHRKF